MSTQNLITFQDLLQIVELIKSSSHFNEFHLKTGELEVDIKRAGSGVRAPASPLPAPAAATDAARQSAPSEVPAIAQAPGPAAAPQPQTAAVDTGKQTQGVQQQLDIPENAILVTSPMVGTFYRAPEPGAAPFIEIGQEADESTIVCLIEVMKLINSIPAGRKGVVTHIYVSDGEPVEYGQVLMALQAS